MKKLILLLLFVPLVSFGQINAITDKGDEVLLYENGSWTYKSQDKVNTGKISINKTSYKKGKNSNFLVKSSKTKAGVYIDPSKWSFEKNKVNGDAEYTFNLRGEDLYGQIINERIEVPLETMRKLALENFSGVMSDAKIVKSDYRNVNGLEVLMVHMEGSNDGIKIFYYGYYSNFGGTNQLVVYSTQALFDEYFDEIQTFLNGLILF